ncbi:hypothetical protein [Modestobacter excelsi]|uniref:hypothetical protein n=1 Tax=Modestobacter excelsi TaxID=2213161 RepID=UPI00110D06DD|nr:hypothetical protein [Modestobacter excelsi]
MTGPTVNMVDHLAQFQLPQLDGGSWPEWISAIGSVLALVFAALAVWAALKANRHQSRQIELLLAEQQEARNREERSQAELVYAWWGKLSPKEGPLLINRSGLPVHRFVATVRDFRDVTQTFGSSVLAPTDTPTYYEQLPDTSRGGSVDRSQAIGMVIGVEVEFTDKSWTRWRRDVNGELHKVGKADPYPEKLPPGGRPFDPSVLR